MNSMPKQKHDFIKDLLLLFMTLSLTLSPLASLPAYAGEDGDEDAKTRCEKTYGTNGKNNGENPPLNCCLAVAKLPEDSIAVLAATATAQSNKAALSENLAGTTQAACNRKELIQNSIDQCVSERAKCEKKGGSPAKSPAQIKDCEGKVDADLEKVKGQITSVTNACNKGKEITPFSKDEGNPQSQPEQAGSSGGGGMGGAMMGALAGGLLGYMMAKKEEKDKDKKKNDGALLDNGQIDCSKSDAYRYADCDSYLISNCSATATSAPANCKSFQSRYCSSTTKSGAPEVIDIQDGTAQVNIAGSGEGLGSTYCKNVIAAGYCKTSGREQCPSCLQLKTNQSPACQNDPALCIAQNSPEQINNAKSTCPTDPAFSDPKYASGGGSQVPTQQRNEGLPAVVLPQSAALGGGSAVGNSQASAGSVAGEKANEKTASNDSDMSPNSVGAIRGTNGRGPASDVASSQGPSLFATGSSALKTWCQQVRRADCPQ